MFVESQPWQRKHDYKTLIDGLDPPPPPGNESLWELHFCKWWGWNWVQRKMEVEEPLIRKSKAPKPLGDKESEKPEKKPVKHLYNCLRFKKKKDQDLQRMYNTPSNSVIENTNKQVQTPISPVHNVSSNCCSDPENKMVQTSEYTNETRKHRRSNAAVQKDIEEQVIRDVNNDHHKKKKKKKEQSTTTTSEDLDYSVKIDKNGSSTEESVEYININCPCCLSKEQSSQIKPTYEKYTQNMPPQNKVGATQTEGKEKKHRRKHICVICHCKCQQNYPPPYCGCSNSDRTEEKESRFRQRCLEPTFCTKEVYRSYVDHGSPFKNEFKQPIPKQPTHLCRKFEPLYVTGMPIDDMLCRNKPFTKFGLPSRSYSWAYAEKPNMWEDFSYSRSHEFSSPVSGKTYNISPIKLPQPEPEPSWLHPLGIDEEMENLKKIESDIKMNLKSRIMLDAVCDAILAKGKEVDTSSSVLLNEFIYPNIRQTESIISDLYKSEQTYSCSKLKETSLDEIISQNAENKSSNKVNCEMNTSRWSLSLGNQENNSSNTYPNAHSPQMNTMQNSCRRLFHNPSISLDYNSHRESTLTSIGNGNPFKLVDYAIANNPPLFSSQKQLIPSRTKLIPTSKRSASPGARARDIKKAKLGESLPLLSSDNMNALDIFKKVDEIISRSKVNNEEIQNVLNTIPERTFQFFTSLEVSKSAKKNSPVQDTEQKETVNLGVIAAEEEKKEKNDKTKAPQAKKKRVYSRPSMIPKRVTDPKLNKNNVSQ